MSDDREERAALTRQMGDGYTLSLNLVVSTVLGLGLGLLLDNWLETKPIFLLIGLALGFAAGLRVLIQHALREMRAAENEKDSE